MNEIIKETKDYMLTVGTFEGKKELGYIITNKKYNVVEIETSILPQALKYLDDLQVGLVALKDMQEPTNNKVESIVPFNKKH